MPSKKNQTSLKEFSNVLEQYNEFFITENKGMSVAEISSLRKKLKADGAVYKIVKNRVFKIALHEKNITDMDPFLKKSSGIVFTKDPIKSAKALGDFLKVASEKIDIKGGYAEGKLVDANYIKTLSTLSSKEELVSKLMMILKNPVQKLTVALNAIAEQKTE